MAPLNDGFSPLDEIRLPPIEKIDHTVPGVVISQFDMFPRHRMENGKRMNGDQAYRLEAPPTIVDEYKNFEHCEVGIAAMGAKGKEEEINTERVPTGLNMPALVVPCMLFVYRPLNKPLKCLGAFTDGIWTSVVLMMSLVTRTKLAQVFKRDGGLYLGTDKNKPGVMRVFEQRTTHLGATYGGKKMTESPGKFKMMMKLIEQKKVLKDGYNGPSTTTLEKLVHHTAHGDDNAKLISKLKSDGYTDGHRVTAIGMLEGHALAYPKSMVHPHTEMDRSQLKRFIEEPGGPMPPVYRNINRGARDAFRKSLWFALMLLGLSTVAGTGTSIQVWRDNRASRVFVYPAYTPQMIGDTVQMNPLCLNYGINVSSEYAERIVEHNVRLGCGYEFLAGSSFHVDSKKPTTAHDLTLKQRDEWVEKEYRVDPTTLMCEDKEKIKRYFLVLSNSENPDYIYGHASLWRASFQKACAIEKYGYMALFTHSHYIRILVEALGIEDVYYDNVNESMVYALKRVVSGVQTTFDYVWSTIMEAGNRIISMVTSHKVWADKIKATFDAFCFFGNHLILLGSETLIYGPFAFFTRAFWKFCCTPGARMIWQGSKNWTTAAWRGQLMVYAYAVCAQSFYYLLSKLNCKTIRQIYKGPGKTQSATESVVAAFVAVCSKFGTIMVEKAIDGTNHKVPIEKPTNEPELRSQVVFLTRNMTGVSEGKPVVEWVKVGSGAIVGPVRLGNGDKSNLLITVNHVACMAEEELFVAPFMCDGNAMFDSYNTVDGNASTWIKPVRLPPCHYSNNASHADYAAWIIGPKGQYDLTYKFTDSTKVDLAALLTKIMPMPNVLHKGCPIPPPKPGRVAFQGKDADERLAFVSGETTVPVEMYQIENGEIVRAYGKMMTDNIKVVDPEKGINGVWYHHAHTISTRHGDSGAPMWTTIKGKRVIVALHCGAIVGKSYNACTPTDVLVSEMCGMDRDSGDMTPYIDFIMDPKNRDINFNHDIGIAQFYENKIIEVKRPSDSLYYGLRAGGLVVNEAKYDKHKYHAEYGGGGRWHKEARLQKRGGLNLYDDDGADNKHGSGADKDAVDKENFQIDSASFESQDNTRILDSKRIDAYGEAKDASMAKNLVDDADRKAKLIALIAQAKLASVAEGNERPSGSPAPGVSGTSGGEASMDTSKKETIANSIEPETSSAVLNPSQQDGATQIESSGFNEVKSKKKKKKKEQNPQSTQSESSATPLEAERPLNSPTADPKTTSTSISPTSEIDTTIQTSPPMPAPAQSLNSMKGATVPVVQLGTTSQKKTPAPTSWQASIQRGAEINEQRMRLSVQSGFFKIVHGYRQVTSDGKETFKAQLIKDMTQYGMTELDIIGLLDGTIVPSTLAAKHSGSNLRRLMTALSPAK